jgi:hypothetical protein
VQNLEREANEKSWRMTREEFDEMAPVLKVAPDFSGNPYFQ